jgi:hypothetical protein
MQALRHQCRRCRLKLAEPTDNPRSAFCCRGCHRQHYERHCLACERPMERKSSTQKVCHRRHCSAQFRELKRHHLLGRHYARPGVSLASRTPISIGSDGGDQGRPNPRIVAGSLTPDQVRLATVGAAYGNCPFKLDRDLNRKYWQAAIDANGHFTEPDWREVISADDVRCFVQPN